MRSALLPLPCFARGRVVFIRVIVVVDFDIVAVVQVIGDGMLVGTVDAEGFFDRGALDQFSMAISFPSERA